MVTEQQAGRRTLRRRPGGRRGRPGFSGAGAGLAIAGLVAAAGAVRAQDEGSQIWQRLFRGSATVEVVSLEVQVRDARGRPVSGLQKDDFAVTVAGRPVPVDNFFAVEGRAGAAPQPAAPAAPAAPADPSEPASPDGDPAAPFLALYVDHANLTDRDRTRVLAAVRELLDEVPGPLRGTVLSNDRGLVVHQPVTSSRPELLAALERVETGGALRNRFESDRRQLLLDLQRVDVEKGSGVLPAIKPRGGTLDPGSDEGGEGPRSQDFLTDQAVLEAQTVLARIRSYARERADHSRATLEVLRGLVASVGGLPGRKAVVVLTGGLPLRPGEPLYEAFSRRFAPLRDVGGNFHPEAEGERDDATPELERLLAEANASGVSFYVLDAAPTRTLDTGSAETAHVLAQTFASWDDGVAALEQEDAQAGLRRLGRETGGAFAPTAASWSEVLGGLLADAGSYYSLGIPGRALADDESQQVEVRVRGRDLDVRHRASLRRRTPRERAMQATWAALALDAADDPLGIEVTADGGEPLAGGTFAVPLAVRVPLDRIVLAPGASQHTARVWLLVAAQDARGRTSQLAEHVCPIRIPNEEVLTSAGRSAVCGVRLEMRPGAQRVAVTVLDEAAGVAATALRALDVGAGGGLDAASR